MRIKLAGLILLLLLCQGRALRAPVRRGAVGGRLSAASSVLIDLAAVDAPALKMKILQMGAALDRGQLYNPTSSDAYREPMERCRAIIDSLCQTAGTRTPSAAIEGEWELVYTTVPHGIFRSSPFFLAIQEAYAMAGSAEKANLFFKLHELQTCSWGISKIGRVAQVINMQGDERTLVSEFDTNLFSLTVIPILGWGKLLPTFGGCVVTVSKVLNFNEESGELRLEVDYTTAKTVPGLNALPGNIGVGWKVPVGAVWRFLPWNGGRAATGKSIIYSQ